MASVRAIVVLLGAALLASACSGGAGSTASPSPATSSLSPGATSAAPGQPAATQVIVRPEQEVVLAVAGDVMLGRSIGDGIRQHGAVWPFEAVAGTLRGADIAFANLEAPLTARGEAAAKDFVFRGPPEGAQGLAAAGVGIVSLANNHVLDYGYQGLQDTWSALNEAGVLHVGSGESVVQAYGPVFIERKGVRIAFLAYVSTPPDSGSGFDPSSWQATADRPGVAWLAPETVASDVAAAKRQADAVVVSMHTGDEYQEAISPSQAAAAHSAIEAGASLVIGHHPHVLQGIESYKGGIIAYSMGNFVFDFDEVDYAQPEMPSALSAILRVRLGKEGLSGCEVAPVIIGEDGRPRPAEGPEAARVLERLRRLSDGSCGLQ